MPEEQSINLPIEAFVGLMGDRGRTVLGVYDIPDGYIVLCGGLSGPQPYATWSASASGDTFWGHYFDRRVDAEEDFLRRIERGY